MDTEDSALIERYRQGDDAAFSALLARYLGSVYAYALSLLHDEATAEDVTQETFIKAWKHLGGFRNGRNFRAWILTIARNTAFDHLRKKKAIPFSFLRKSAEEDDPRSFADTLSSNDPSPEDEAILGEDIADLQAALPRLSSSAREVIYLHLHEELTFDEIGAIKDEPLHTVKSRYRRALQTLRILINNAGA